MRDVLLSQLGQLHHPVQVRVVGEVTLEHDFLPNGQVSRVNGDTAVLLGSALTDVAPVSFLFSKIEASRISEEDPTEDET